MADIDRTPIPCFKCEEVLQNFDTRPGNHPIGGIEFTSVGHYGTTVFDPMDGSRIALNICDSCLRMGIHRGNILKYPVIRGKPKILTEA